jgi:RNA polymerase sigma factor (sigma-70 family)
MPALVVVTRSTDGDTDDRDLVAGVRAGDDRAFELLFQRYQPRIAAYVRGMVRDHGRAEDITQDVFISALRRMREDTEREILFKPWIYEIAKNRCIDAFRRSRNASEVSFDARDAIGAAEHRRLAEPGATPDSAVEGKVAIDNLCGAFGGLSQVHHDILVLRELEGLSYREIGERLGMTRPAVESTLFRARKRLTEEYEELVSGARCVRVQRIVDASRSSTAGLRDQRRMARHLAHCQPCRRYAGRAGLEVGAIARPVAAAGRIAAFLPLPTMLRRRWGGDEAAPLLGHGGSGGQLPANIVALVDPGVVANWTKAVATAATVAVAGMGAGAAFTHQAPFGGSAKGAPFGHTAGLGMHGAGPVGATSHSAREVRRGATSVRRAPAGSSQAGGPGAAASARTAVMEPTLSAKTVSKPGGVPVRPFVSDAIELPESDITTGDDRGSVASAPANPVARVLGAVGGGASPGGDSPAGSAPEALVNSATEPVATVVEAVSVAALPAVEAVVAGDPTVTAVVDSVSSTVTEPLASTTTKLDDLGG